jgi:hypothetical protein
MYQQVLRYLVGYVVVGEVHGYSTLYNSTLSSGLLKGSETLVVPVSNE